jgi:hypothetical protein
MRAIHSGITDDNEKRAREGWITHSYAKKLRRLRRSERRWGASASAMAFVVALLGALGAVAGALGKGIAKNSTWSIIAIVTGSGVTAITGLTRARQPEVEHERLARTRAQLRREGWSYVQPIGGYKKRPEDGDDYLKFAERVFAILDSYEKGTASRGQRTTQKPSSR